MTLQHALKLIPISLIIYYIIFISYQTVAMK